MLVIASKNGIYYLNLFISSHNFMWWSEL